MSFTIEREKQNRLPFLDIEIICADIMFTTSVYCTPTLAYRCLQICSSWTKLHNELVCLKEILKNGYPDDFIDKRFMKFMGNMHM